MEEVFEESRLIQESRGNKPLKVIDNILNGVTIVVRKVHFMRLIKTIDLTEPLLFKQFRQSIKSLINLSLDPQGREYKNVSK